MTTGTELWDVVVCGAGSAGLPAAIFAAARGAKVLLVDAAPEVGGSLHVAGGHMSAAGTRVQAEKGIADTAEDHFQDVMRISKGTADAEMVRLAVENAADTLHWLLDLGLELTPESPVISFGHEPYRTPRTYFGPEKAVSILNVLKPVLAAWIAQGAITMRLETKVVGLLSEGGAVTGVVLRHGNTERREHATNVLLTTGGYAASEELFQQLSGNYPLYTQAYPHSRGEGIRLARDAGATVQNGEKYLPTYARVEDVPGSRRVATMTRMVPQIRAPWEIHVNLDGKRFVAEDNPSPDAREHALIRQRDLTFWVVFDEEILRRAPSLFIDLDEQRLNGLWNTHPSFRRADSLAALAQATGLDPKALETTVGRYNNSVRSGQDCLGRQHLPAEVAAAPFYAVKHHGMSVVSFGGVRVDRNMRVMRGDGSAIPNLYAAGEMLGFGLLNGQAFVGGMSVTPAMTFGRLLGQRILKWPDAKSVAAE